MCEKDYIWNPNTCICDNDKYLTSIIDDSVIMLDEIIKVKETNPTKTIPTNFRKKKVTCKIKKLYILLTFLLTTLRPLISLVIGNHYLLLLHKT